MSLPTQTFGTWIRDERTKRNLSLQGLADASRVDHGVLSRIERNQTKPTFQTAVRLFEALGLTPHDVIDVLRPQARHKDQRTSSVAQTIPDGRRDLPVNEVLTFDHVVDLVSFASEVSQRGYVIIGQTLNIIVQSLQAQSRQIGIKTRQATSDRTGLGERTRSLAPETVQALLDDTPLYLFKIRYPDLEPEDTITLFEHGCVLIQDDIDHFLKKVYASLPIPRNPHRGLASVLDRLATGNWQRIGLDDVLDLDEYLKLGMRGLFTYWLAVKMSDEVVHSGAQRRGVKWPASWSDPELRLATVFIILARWLYYCHQPSVEVFDRLRRDAEADYQLTPA